MKKITIPYGNWGERQKTYDALFEYNGFTLILDEGHGLLPDEYKIVGPKGMILLRNTYNRHLPDITPETWKLWVDWVLSLDPETPNVTDMSGKEAIDFSGFALNGPIKNMQ